MPTLAAKDILRVDLSKLIRFWVRERPDPKKNPAWVELGHFFAGFDFKLTAVRETDGAKRENANCGYEATGTFRLAQNAIADYQAYQVLTGPLAVAMLVGRTWEPTHGKLWVFDWHANADGSVNDNRIALVGDPDYNTQMAESGSISGWIRFFDLYLVKNLSLTNGKLQYQSTESLWIDAGIASLTNGGS